MDAADLPEHLQAIFRQIVAYYGVDGNSTGGYLHIVLDDGNMGENHIAFCRDEAAQAGDQAAVEIAEALLALPLFERVMVIEAQSDDPVFWE